MITQILCESDDLGAALSYARRQYQTLAPDIVRPSTRNLIYTGVDTLLCRLSFRVDQVQDTLQILKLSSDDQEIIPVVDFWAEGGYATSWPFYFGDVYQPYIDSSYDFLQPSILPGMTGQLVVIGSDPGTPIKLISSDPAVLSVEPMTWTWAEIQALSPGVLWNLMNGTSDFAWNGVPFADFDPEQWLIAGFFLTVNATGRASLTLSREGQGAFRPLHMFGGKLVFPQNVVHEGGSGEGGGTEGGGAVAGGECYVHFDKLSYVSSGGAVAGGECQSHFNNQISYKSSGGAVAGGSCGVARKIVWISSGGAVAGGQLRRYRGAAYGSSGGAVAGGGAGFRSFVHVLVRSSGGAVAGGGAGFSVFVKAVFRSSGGAVAGGQHHFAHGIVFNGKGGAVAGGQVVSTNVSTAKPAALAFSQVIPYASCHDPLTGAGTVFAITIHGTAVNGGTLTYHVKPVNGGNCTTTLRVTSLGVSVTFTPTGVAWYGATWFEYYVTETKNGVAVDSDVAKVTVQVQAPGNMTYSYQAGNLLWTGGAAPFVVRLKGSYTNLSVASYTGELPSGSLVRITASNGVTFRVYPTNSGAACCTSTDYVEVTDQLGKKFTVLMTLLGIPLCSATPPDPPPEEKIWKWVLKWTCPAGDVRNFASWGSYLTYTSDCKLVSPYNMPQLALTSADGKWQLIGNYFSPIPGTGALAGCAVSSLGSPQAVLDLVGNAQFPFCFFGWSPYLKFYIHKLYAWEFA